MQNQIIRLKNVQLNHIYEDVENELEYGIVGMRNHPIYFNHSDLSKQI